MKTFSIEPIGVIRSEIKNRDDAPLFYTEGAPNAHLELSPSYWDGMEGMKVGDEIIVITWLHRAGRETSWNSFREGLAKEFGTSVESLNQAYGNLFRLGLCRIRNYTLGPVIEFGPFGHFFLAAAYGPGMPST